MLKVTIIVTVFTLFAWGVPGAANQAFLSGTEIVIDLKKIEIPHEPELISAALMQKSNQYYSFNLFKEIFLNGQKIKVYFLNKRPIWQ